MHEFTRVGLELTDGSNVSIKGRKAKVGGSRNYLSSSDYSLFLRFPGTETEPEFVWQRDKIDGTSCSIQLHVKNTTSKPLPVEKMIVYTTGFEGTLQVAHAPLPFVDHEQLLSQFAPHDVEKPLPWIAQIIDGKGGKTLIGFITAKEQAGYIAIKENGEVSEATAFTLAEGVEIHPGKGMSSEKVLVSFEQDYHKAVALYAKTIAKEMYHSLPLTM